MFVCKIGCFTTARGPFYESFFYKKRFIHVFNCPRILSERCRDGIQPDRAAGEFVDYRGQYAVIHIVQPVGIDIRASKP